jgi:hypothetical protein
MAANMLVAPGTVTGALLEFRPVTVAVRNILLHDELLKKDVILGNRSPQHFFEPLLTAEGVSIVAFVTQNKTVDNQNRAYFPVIRHYLFCGGKVFANRPCQSVRETVPHDEAAGGMCGAGTHGGGADNKIGASGCISFCCHMFPLSSEIHGRGRSIAVFAGSSAQGG